MEVIEAPGSSLDWAEGGISCFGVVEDGIFVAIFLVHQGDGDCCGLQAQVAVGGGRERGVPNPQPDVLFPEGDGASLARLPGALPHPEQKEKGQDDQICDCSKPGFLGVQGSLLGQPSDSGDREGQLGTRWRVGILAAPEEIGEDLVKVFAWVHFPGVAETPGDHDL